MGGAGTAGRVERQARTVFFLRAGPTRHLPVPGQASCLTTRASFCAWPLCPLSPARSPCLQICDVVMHADAIHRGGGQIIPTARRAM